MNDSINDHPIIRAKQAEIEKKLREIELLEAEVRGMLAFAQGSLQTRTTIGTEPLPRAPSGTMVKTGNYRGGRQPGAISTPWRRILSQLYWNGDGHGQVGATFDLNRIITAARKQGLNIRPSEALARMRRFDQYDYVGSVPDGYRVLMVAAERFGFRQGPLKDEAPDDHSSEPHKSLETGDRTGAV